MTSLLEDVDDVELVLGEDLGEPIGIVNGLGRRRGLFALDVAQSGGIEDVRAHPERLGRLPGDGQGITGDHLHVHTHLQGGGDCHLGVVAWWIEQGQHADEVPRPVAFGPGHTQRTEASCREPVYCGVDLRLHL